MLIKELFERGNLSNDEVLELLMFVGFPKNRTSEAQNNILKKALSIQPPLQQKIILHRGLYPQEIQEITKTNKLTGRIMSFSADILIAQTFMWKAQITPPYSEYAQIISVEFPAGSKGILDVVSFISSCPKEMIKIANEKVNKGYDTPVDLINLATTEKEFIVSSRNYIVVSSKDNVAGKGANSRKTSVSTIMQIA
jgi:hypothetical protein